MIYSENIKVGKKGIKLTDKHGRQLSYRQASQKAHNRIFNWFLDLMLFFTHLVSFHVPFHSLRKMVFRGVGVKIGKGSSIHMGCKFFSPKGVSIGKDTIIGDRAFLDGRAPLVIGDHVDIASEVMIYNSEHDINSETFEAIEEPVEISDYVFIGPRAIILPGVNVGKGAVIGAGAVVTKDVSDYQIVGGVPAKIIGKRSLKKCAYKLGRPRLFQ